MVVKLIVPVLPDDPPCYLYLKPETDEDRNTLENLLERGLTSGFGLDATTGEVIHVQINVAA